MTLVTTDFQNELVQHSAGIVYQALGQKHKDFKRIEIVSAHNRFRSWPGRDDRKRDNVMERVRKPVR